MTLISGEPGNTIVGSDHVGWKTAYVQVSANIINQTLLDAVLTGNVQFPIIRVYAVNAATNVETEISDNVAYFRTGLNKSRLKGTFSMVVRPEKIAPEFTNLFTTLIPANNNYYIKIRAGYIINGVEILVPIFTGVQIDRQPAYGRNSTAINVSGFDFMDLLERVDGIWSGYTSAKSLIIAILNQAGLTSYDFTGFTDIDITGKSFNQNNGIDVISRISEFAGEVTWYFNGAGIFRMTDLASDTTAKYTYSTDIMQDFQPFKSSRGVLTEVIVVGDSISLTRRTDLADQTKYGGIRRRILQNSLISTEAEAIAAADTLINESRTDKGGWTTAFNPFVYIDDILQTTQQEVGTDIKYRVEGLTHFYSNNRLQTRTEMERTDGDLPTTISTVVE